MTKSDQSMGSEKIELIKHAAVISEGGMIFLGKSHSDCFHQAFNVGVKMSSGAEKQGFFTNKGRFVTRSEAAQIARDAGQISPLINILFSEDLWSESHGGKYSYCQVEGYHDQV
jgi:hypothetical protein